MCECDRLSGLLVSAPASQPSVMGSNLTLTLTEKGQEITFFVQEAVRKFRKVQFVHLHLNQYL